MANLTEALELELQVVVLTSKALSTFHAMAVPLAVLDLYRVTDTMWVQESDPCYKPYSNDVPSSGSTKKSAETNLASRQFVLAGTSSQSTFGIQAASKKENKSVSDMLSACCGRKMNNHGKNLLADRMKDPACSLNDQKPGRRQGPGILKLPDAFLDLDSMGRKENQKVRFDEDSIQSTSTRLNSNSWDTSL